MIFALAGLARAQDYEEVALAALVHAQDTGLPADYAAAVEPLTSWTRAAQGPGRFEAAWYTAYAYQQSENYERAVPIYEALIETAAYHPHGDGAIVGAVRSLLDQLRRDEGDLSTVTDSALSDLDVAFIAAADRALAWPFAEPAPDQTDFGAYVASQRAALTYLPAQLLFTHGRYDEARPRLLAVIDDPRTRCSTEASYAATYLIDTYQQEGDLTQIRLYTKRFILNPPGCRGMGSPTPWPPDPPPPPPRAEQIEFKLCIEATRADDHAAAAQCFLDWVQGYPTSDYRDEALYNAANQYDLAGQALRANELYEQFVDEYPKDEKSAGLYFRIAANHEQLLELREAMDHYSRLVANFPTSPVAADAQYNLAFLSIAAGDPLSAARGFEAYASKYPDSDDAIDTLWRAGEQYEAVGATQAIAFYEKYRTDHGAENPDRLLQCDRKIAQMYQKLGNTKKADEYLGSIDRTGRFVSGVLLKDWESIEAAGRTGEVQREGRHAAAESAFLPIQVQYDALVRDRLPGRQELEAGLLSKKLDEAKAFRANSLTLVPRFADFEISTKVFLYNARAFLYYVNLGNQIADPDFVQATCNSSGFSEGECFAYQQLLEESLGAFQEYEDVARRELEQIIKLADDKKLWSTWVDLAAAELHALEPDVYAAPKHELKGQVASDVPASLGPLPVRP